MPIFRDKGVGMTKRLLISASFALPVVSAAILAYIAFREQSEALKMAGLVFVARLYMLVAVEDMLREAHESAEDNRWSVVSLLILRVLCLSWLLRKDLNRAYLESLTS